MKQLRYVLTTFFMVVILICSWYLYSYFEASIENKAEYQRIEETAFPVPEESVDDETEKEIKESKDETGFDYDSLAEINSDCIGWICIEDTEIDYPVMQTSDNEYYLHRNFYQEYAACGAIFMDCRNDIARTQEHLILYGHQMKDGSMFKQLNGYKDKAFWEMHPEITLYLKNEKYVYDVAAVFITNDQKSGDYYDYLHSETRNQQMEYLKNMAAYQLYDTDIKVHGSDELLSLSTCEYSSKNGRLIVLAVRQPERRQLDGI